MFSFYHKTGLLSICSFCMVAMRVVHSGSVSCLRRGWGEVRNGTVHMQAPCHVAMRVVVSPPPAYPFRLTPRPPIITPNPPARTSAASANESSHAAKRTHGHDSQAPTRAGATPRGTRAEPEASPNGQRRHAHGAKYGKGAWCSPVVDSLFIPRLVAPVNFSGHASNAMLPCAPCKYKAIDNTPLLWYNTDRSRGNDATDTRQETRK